MVHAPGTSTNPAVSTGLSTASKDGLDKIWLHIWGVGMCGDNDGIVELYDGRPENWIIELDISKGTKLGAIKVQAWVGDYNGGVSTTFELGELVVRRYTGEAPGCERQKADPGLPALGVLKEFPKVPRAWGSTIRRL